MLKVKTILNRILYLGFGIQIILGVIWMCSNFALAPDVMSVLQLAFAFIARYSFTGILLPGNKWKRVFVTMALLTVPFSMQCHMQSLFFSYLSSFFYFLFTDCYQVFRLKKGTENMGKKRRGGAVSGLIISICAIAFVTGVQNGASPVAGRDVEARLASRMAWPTLWVDMEPWSEELRELLPSGIVWEAAFSPDGMAVLFDKLEAEVGEEAAKDYYMEMAATAWSRRKPSILRQMAWDVLGYSVSPIVVPMQLRGEAYDSYTGTNYGLMMEHTPKLTRIYAEYGCWWFVCCLGYSLLAGTLTLVQRIVQRVKGKECTAVVKVTKKGIAKTALFLGVPALYIALLTMRGSGLMDYRFTVFVTELWLVLSLRIATVENGSEEKQRKEEASKGKPAEE